ncbi:glycosyltransferase family 39 protein [Colwellia sp. 1_MG-2023]|uniref:ArnT family glycosyltransferase n=1 Tax=Colwellia sp. 1_MG-2023 TaxID=3062649 RepID=UPI0026E4225C|nr:glycosyltransferase family 39 protein [Colwellia sp. 1_MG-2023]MDO6444971.1 glycosyltransferase family 39 protein [Colwellia sp. 1_MG-2023]
MQLDQLNINKNIAYGLFFVCLVISLVLKLNVLEVGAPFVTIDDNTTYEGGFLVWFGQAPPQRMYLESWINGLSSIVTYVIYQITNGGSLGVNLVADAYNHYLTAPDLYVKSYRIVSLFIDLLTAYFVFLTAKILLPNRHHIPALLVTALYLLSYNTIWCYVVARPDTPMVLLSTIGLYFYYRSDFGKHFNSFLLSALFLGIATGMKLHGAFFVIFIIIDLYRVHRFKTIISHILPFGFLSVMAFAVATGSVLFDPLTYIKLRVLNAKDDASPWIVWGEQFLEIFQGTGIFTVPLIIFAIVLLLKNEKVRQNNRFVSVLLLSVCWLMLFASIRQLRAYWMLPALPLFYILATYVLCELKSKWLAIATTLLMLGVMSFQSFQQSYDFKKTPFDEFRTWVETNVKQDEKLFIFGYDALFLPLSLEAANVIASGYQSMMVEAKQAGESYTERHVRFWEERTKLKLIDMYNLKNKGFTYYSYHKAPLKSFAERIDFENMDYIAVLDGFISETINIDYLVKHKYSKVASVIGPGGGGSGLTYTIYQKVDNFE